MKKRPSSRYSGIASLAQSRRVLFDETRTCPHCDSNKWEWLEAVPITLEELSQHLLVKYRCRKCGHEFVVEEAKGAKFVASAEKCVHCNKSNKLKKISAPGADLELWQCLQCNAFMAVQKPE